MWLNGYALDLRKIGEKNEAQAYEYVAELIIKQDIRSVEHDGYCSDAGEDTGEWQHDQTEIYRLNGHYYLTLLKYADHDTGKVDLEILKILLPDKMGCEMGSGYCGYEGERSIKEGYLRLTLPRKDDEMKVSAYLLAEKDKFQKSPEYYWNLAQERARRRTDLQKALAEKGLVIRSDSKLCEKWINNELEPNNKYHTVEDIVQTMIECRWCIEYCNMKRKMEGYKILYEPDPLDNVFSLVKEMILQEYPVPSPLPWQQ